MIADAMRYLVVSADRGDEYLPERHLSDLDRTTTIRDIANGQFGEVSHVLEFNIAERIIHDVTEDILREAEEQREAAPRRTGQDQLDWLRDHARKLRGEG
jgi:hypothetical protein